MSVLCIHLKLDHGQGSGLVFGAGVAAADLTYAAIAAFGVTAVSFASVATIASALQSVTFAAGVFAGSMLWWVILTTLVSKTAALFRPSMLLWINRISGAVLVAFAVYGFTTLM